VWIDSGMGTEFASDKSLSVVMPFYNEARTLRPALERLLKTDLPVRLQVVLVDDGSTDDSVRTIEDLLSDDRILLVTHTNNSGKGRAVRSGLAEADSYLAGVLDADMEYDPDDLKRLLAVILEGDATVAYGTRSFGPGSIFSFWYVLGNKVTSFWASLLFNTWLTDIHTCLKVAPLEVWHALELRCDGFDLDSEATARFRRAGHRIYEVPVSYTARGRAEGKKLHWIDGIKSLWILTRVRLSRR
jgi:glycosyltransferase involved in cell wall biosynthesis